MGAHEDERSEFDYINWDKVEKGEDSASFLLYRGDYYDLSEFTVPPPVFKNLGWDGYRPDSFFSGLLVKYVDDESVVVGLYLT